MGGGRHNRPRRPLARAQLGSRRCAGRAHATVDTAAFRRGRRAVPEVATPPKHPRGLDVARVPCAPPAVGRERNAFLARRQPRRPTRRRRARPARTTTPLPLQCRERCTVRVSGGRAPQAPPTQPRARPSRGATSLSALPALPQPLRPRAGYSRPRKESGSSAPRNPRAWKGHFPAGAPRRNSSYAYSAPPRRSDSASASAAT